jgi:hypothetical protein
MVEIPIPLEPLEPLETAPPVVATTAPPNSLLPPPRIAKTAARVDVNPGAPGLRVWFLPGEPVLRAERSGELGNPIEGLRQGVNLRLSVLPVADFQETVTQLLG